MICLIFFVLFASTYCDVTEEDNVLVVTADNWDEAVTTDGNVLVEFYSTQCSRCKTLAPEYAKAATILKVSNSDIRLAKVNANIERTLLTKFKVKDYPTLIFFRKEDKIEYTGGRTAEDIIAWLKKKTGPPAADLESAEKIANFVADRDVAVLGFFADKENELAKAYLAAADAIDDIEFGISAPDAGSAYDVTGDRIIIVKKFDNLRADYEGDANVDNIKDFIKLESPRLVIEFTPENARYLFGYDVKPYIMLFISKTSDNFTTILEAFTSTSEYLKGKAYFIYSDVDVKDEYNLLFSSAVKRKDIPTVRIIKLQEDLFTFAPEDNNLTKESFTRFLQRYLDGHLKPITTGLPTEPEEAEEADIKDANEEL